MPAREALGSHIRPQVRSDEEMMRVRDYTAADLGACLAVFDSNVPRFFAPSEREEFAAFLAAPLPGPFLVMESEAGEVLGCGGYRIRPGSTEADLCWGMIQREHHGTGLGRLLLDARLERIHADPAALAVAVHTSQHTRGFYEHRGFRTVRIVPDGYAPGLDRCDLRLTLSAPAGRIRSDRTGGPGGSASTNHGPQGS